MAATHTWEYPRGAQSCRVIVRQAGPNDCAHRQYSKVQHFVRLQAYDMDPWRLQDVYAFINHQTCSVSVEVFAAADISPSCLLKVTTQLTAVAAIAAGACKAKRHLKMEGVVARVQGLRWRGTQGHQVLQIGHVHQKPHLQHIVQTFANTDRSLLTGECLALATAPLLCNVRNVQGSPAKS